MRKHFLLFTLTCLAFAFTFAQSDNKRVEYYDDGGLKSEGHYSSGKKEGPWVFYFEGDGKKKQMEGIFKGGVKYGHWKTYYRSGQVKAEGSFTDNLGQATKTGTWTWYHKNGVKKEEGDYKKGHKVGEWIEWNSLEIPISTKKY